MSKSGQKSPVAGATKTSDAAKEIMKPYRAQIDALDDKIVDLLIERIGIVREVAKTKSVHGIPAVLEDRIAEVIDRAGDRVEAALDGEQGEDDADRIREVYALLVVICCELEEELMEKK